MSEDPANDLAKQLDEVQAREAAFRLQAIQDHRAAHGKLRQLEEELAALRNELAGRNTYIHELHLAHDAIRADRESLVQDLAHYAALLQASEEELRKHRRRSSKFSEAFAVFGRALTGSNTETDTPRRHVPAPRGSFKYYFYTSPYRIHRGEKLLLKGWCFSEDKRPITAVRARLDDLEFIGRHGLEDAEVTRVHGEVLKGAQPGFEIELKTTPGDHLLSVEVCLDNRDWLTVLTTVARVNS